MAVSILKLHKVLEDFKKKGNAKQGLYVLIGEDEEVTAELMTEEQVIEHAKDIAVNPDVEFDDVDEALVYIGEMTTDMIYEVEW